MILREFSAEDAPHFYRLNGNPNVVRFTGDAAIANEADAEIFLRNYGDYRENGFGRWAVIRKSDSKFLGWCGLKKHRQTDEVDIGFRFFEEFWNAGYATESASACLGYAFSALDLDSVIGRVMRENAASVRVLEKIGLRLEKAIDFEEHPGFLYRIEKESAGFI